jgi:hypothetical protein
LEAQPKRALVQRHSALERPVQQVERPVLA